MTREGAWTCHAHVALPAKWERQASDFHRYGLADFGWACGSGGEALGSAGSIIVAAFQAEAAARLHFEAGPQLDVARLRRRRRRRDRLSGRQPNNAASAPPIFRAPPARRAPAVEGDLRVLGQRRGLRIVATWPRRPREARRPARSASRICDHRPTFPSSRRGARADRSIMARVATVRPRREATLHAIVVEYILATTSPPRAARSASKALLEP